MRLAVALLGCAAFALASCERGVHQMYDQPKYKPLTPTKLFSDGNSSRPQAEGSVPHSSGSLAETSSGRLGTLEPVRAAGAAIGVDDRGRTLAQGSASMETAYSNPLPITAALLARGRERFNIYCAPCHSTAGDGDGMIARRGFPAPPSYHTDRLRNAPDSHFYQVISKGYGVMYPYADRITPPDRWAIVAYIRALQLSQHAPVSMLTEEDQRQLGGPER